MIMLSLNTSATWGVKKILSHSGKIVNPVCLIQIAEGTLTLCSRSQEEEILQRNDVIVKNFSPFYDLILWFPLRPEHPVIQISF